MKYEDSITVAATSAEVFSVYKDVENWPSWDPETDSASLDGEFQVGTSGKIKPSGEPETKIVITEVSPDKSFTVECKIPLCKMQFVHEMAESDDRTHVVNKIILTGLLSSVFGLLIGGKLREGMKQSLVGLKNQIESKG